MHEGPFHGDDELPIALERDIFLRRLLRELSGTLQDVVGLEDAEGLIATVGQAMGDHINGLYMEAVGKDRLDRDEVAHVLVDLKRRIGGGFSVESSSEDAIILTNTKCPFGELVRDRPSLCMMTSNVFGRIAADHLGYARVTLDETIAQGHGGCRIGVHLREDVEGPGRTYHATR